MNRRTWLASVGATLLTTRMRHAGARRRDTAAPSSGRVLDYAGPLSVAIAFQWRSDTIANALATKARPSHAHHILANEAVFDFRITGTAGDQRRYLRHQATPQAPLYDRERNVYMTTPVSGSELQRLLDPTSSATFTVDLSFTLSSFFDLLLAQMTRTDRELRNIARPDDTDAILSTFEHQLRDGRVDILYHSETHHISAMPCRLVGVGVTPQARPHPPAVALVFELDFQTGDGAAGREAMRKLIAMDWSGMARHGDRYAPLPAHVRVWRDNVLLYLANQTDMKRAERFRTSIAARHARKSPRRLATDLAEDIDAHVITANDWGETREDMTREFYQAMLCDLFATLHRTGSSASPIRLARQLVKSYGLGIDDQAALTLQYGTGYCLEHSRSSFSILRTMMSMPGNQLDSIVLCGNANIDHAFVVSNLKVAHVIVTTATNTANRRVGLGKDIKVFNLREALASSPANRVFVVDPYLERSMVPATGERLLRSLHSEKKQRIGKDTDFLMFELQYPEAPDFTFEDIRHRPAAERMALVRNV